MCSSSCNIKIYINIDGNTAVQGLVSVRVRSFEDALAIGREAVTCRGERRRSQGCDAKKHERKTNVITSVSITSVSITSVNIAMWVDTEAKFQFFDMAASDVVRGIIFDAPVE